MKFLPRVRAKGFTLVEIAVVLFILAALLTGLLAPLTAQVDQRKISDTQKSLDEIKEALIGFAASNGYLPCPAKSATDGTEDRAGAVCTAGKRQGYLPWVTLGAPKLDAWGHVFHYSVTPAFTSSAALFTLNTVPDIAIQTRDNTGTLINLTNVAPPTVVLVVLSHGKNGYGGVDDLGNAVGLPNDWPASNTDENTNVAAAGTTFISRTAQGVGAGGAGGGIR